MDCIFETEEEKLKFVITILLVATLLIPISAFANEVISLRQITSYGVDLSPSADDDGWFLITKNGIGWYISSYGSTGGNGLNGVSATVRFGGGVAYYNTTNLMPVVTNSYPTPVWQGNPSIGPRVSQDNQLVAFASGNGRALVVDRTCGVVRNWSPVNAANLTISSIDWGPDGMIYASVQDSLESLSGGYHLYMINPNTGTKTDLGLSGYSELEVSGNDFLFTSANHSLLTWSRWTPSGIQAQGYGKADGATYWNLGGARSDRFALTDQDNRLWEATIISVPEPSSLLALSGGLASLTGIVRRKTRH